MRLTTNELDAISDALGLLIAGSAGDAAMEEGPEWERIWKAAESAMEKVATERERRKAKRK